MDPLNGSASRNVQEISAALEPSARIRDRLSPALLSLRCLALSSQLQPLTTCLSPPQLGEPNFSRTPVPGMSSGEQIDNTTRQNGDMCNHSSPATPMWVYGRQNAFEMHNEGDAKWNVKPSLNKEMVAVGPVTGGNSPCSPLSDKHTIPDSDEVTSFPASDEELESHKSPASICGKKDRERKKYGAQMAECPCGRTFQQPKGIWDDTATSAVEGADFIRKELRGIKQQLELLQSRIASLERTMHHLAPGSIAEVSKSPSESESAAIVADERRKAERALSTNDRKRWHSSGNVMETIPDSQEAAVPPGEGRQGEAKRRRRR